MLRDPLVKHVRRLNRPVFTTREIAALSGKSLSATTQGLQYLAGQGLLLKVRRGLWADTLDERLSVFAAVPFLVHGQRVYVSFVSALHLHGIVEQIPRVTTLASTAHARTIRTSLGSFRIHRIAPSFFSGFDWYRGERSFLIALPEKALVDSLYLSAHKKKQYGHFPELHFPKSFSFRRAGDWATRIPSARVRTHVLRELARLKTAATP
jgi:predicted transcriptional regulator of viral defense system